MPNPYVEDIDLGGTTYDIHDKDAYKTTDETSATVDDTDYIPMSTNDGATKKKALWSTIKGLFDGSVIKTKVAKTGSGTTITNTIAAGTSVDNVVGTLLNNDYAINNKFAQKRAEVSSASATISSKIDQLKTALDNASDEQLGRAYIIRFNTTYNYRYDFTLKTSSDYQFVSIEQQPTGVMAFRQVKIKASSSQAFVTVVSGGTANAITEQTTVLDTSYWELYY